jgi:hypothetical protein
MGESLLRFPSPVKDPQGAEYEARACGAPMTRGGWEGWIEFVPFDGGEPIRGRRETTQPNRVDTEYWATGLTPIYLAGALARALSDPPLAKPAPVPGPSIFAGPAPSTARPEHVARSSVLNPFSVYQKGEALLRNQLRAMSAWHVIQIALDYDLSELDAEALNRLPHAKLVELVVGEVRARASEHETSL